MTTFLERILKVKEEEVKALSRDLSRMEERLAQTREDNTLHRPLDFAQAIRQGDRLSIVSEVKRASPSKGLIAPDFQPIEVAKAYERAGAAAISVLTDMQFFQGSIDDLKAVRRNVTVPILRKDFIIDEAQILEARLAGADAVLLIVAALAENPNRIRELRDYAGSLSLDVLVEVHSEEELELALRAEPSILGINNRNLHTFEVSLETTKRVVSLVPPDVTTIAESGIHSHLDASTMASFGVHGLLVGESLMRAGLDNVEPLLSSLRVPKGIAPTALGTRK